MVLAFWEFIEAIDEQLEVRCQLSKMVRELPSCWNLRLIRQVSPQRDSNFVLRSQSTALDGVGKEIRCILLKKKKHQLELLP